MSYRAVGFDLNGVVRTFHGIDPAVLAISDQIRTQGVRTGIYSNYDLPTANFMRELGLDRHFDVLMVSGQTGYHKPDPRAFGAFARELEVLVTELVFIDDSPFKLPADSGFHPILYQGPAQLRAELKDLNLL